MIHHVCGHMVRSRVFRRVVRNVGAAVLAGVGWSLGADAYKKVREKAAVEEDEDNSATRD